MRYFVEIIGVFDVFSKCWRCFRCFDVKASISVCVRAFFEYICVSAIIGVVMIIKLSFFASIYVCLRKNVFLRFYTCVCAYLNMC